MNKLLKKAFEQIRALPPEDQDRIALAILQHVAPEKLKDIEAAYRQSDIQK